MRWSFVLIALIACSKTDGSSPSPLVGKSRALANQVCTCRDAACIAPIEAQWNELANHQQAQQLSADDVEALASEAQRYAKCVAELRK